MAQHAIALPAAGTPPGVWYARATQTSGFNADPAQAKAIARLDHLYHELLAFKAQRSRLFGKTEVFGFSLREQPALPRGVYFWGGVGRGKSLLMDVFFAALPYRRKQRLHFHDFMRDIHRRLAAHKNEADPLALVAAEIAIETRVLCFDEFHVSDIADAMILGRLLTQLFRAGVVLVATSNYPPDGLYPDGLQRVNFLPTIALIKATLDVFHLDGGADHRRRELAQAPLYLTPLNQEHEASLARMFDALAQGMELDPALTVLGRTIKARRHAPGVVWFDFAVLCGDQRSQLDYLHLAREYETVLLSGIPRLGPGDAALARRLTWLVDVFYDYRVKLMVTAEAGAEALYPQGPMAQEFTRTASRLIEMQSETYLALAHAATQEDRGVVET